MPSPALSTAPAYVFATRSRLGAAAILAAALAIEQATQFRVEPASGGASSAFPSWLGPTHLAFVLAAFSVVLGVFLALELVRERLYALAPSVKARGRVAAVEFATVALFAFGLEPFRVLDEGHGLLAIALASGIGALTYVALAPRAPRVVAGLLAACALGLAVWRLRISSVHYVSEHAASVYTILFCGARAAEMSRPSAAIARGLAPALIVVCLALAHGVLASSTATRAAFYVDTTLGRGALRPLAILLDFDRDGGIAAFGSVDCDPFSAARGPFAQDLPADGVDQDCDGRDARLHLPVTLARRADEPLPDVYLLSADGLRWDAGHRLTRTAQALGERVVFTRAVAPSPRTMNSFATVLRGRPIDQLPFAHETLRSSLRRNVLPTIGDALRARGYRAVYVPPHDYLEPSSGIVTGFEPIRPSPSASADAHGMEGPSAHAALDALLATVRAAEGPLLAMAHLMETHTPYRGTDGALLGTDHAAYRRAVGGVDAALARFITDARALAATRGRPAWFVVYGDHGEAFREHDDANHATSLHAEQIRIVLTIAGAGVGTGRIDTPVSSTALPATLLDLLGLPPEPLFTVPSLGPCMVRGESCPAVATSDLYVLERASDVALRAHTTAGRRAIVDRAHDTARVFDTTADPYETRPRTTSAREALRLLD